ncbi:EscU/YscU/HrcU family type III secretion system export apparatus switch protein, partial [Acinetobacter baumannii]
HYRQMRMSLQELKEESKESEGDPHVKGQIKQRQREAARRRMMSAIPQADVIITNPTHFAVALQYADSMGAPRVVAKGT